MVERCGQCGKLAEVDEYEVMVMESPVPVQTIRVLRCCPPPPTADQLARQADDDWFARHLRLAAD